ncbi:MAG: hypothetical protein ACJ8FT_02540 [Sphingomonas sp.]
MHRLFVVIGAAGALAACGQSADRNADQPAAKSAQPKKKAAYCFFKPSETKGWTASRGKDGNITVKGKAYREDSRYKAVLGPAVVSGTSAELSPSITTNDTGYAAVDNWWDVSATIPNSAAIDTVTVRCGADVLAELKVPVTS